MIAEPGGHDTSKKKRREKGGRKREVTRRNKENEVLGKKVEYEKQTKSHSKVRRRGKKKDT